MASNVQNFISKPTQEGLECMRKDELLELARKYNLSEAKVSLTKQEIKIILIQYLVGKGIFENSALSLKRKPVSGSDRKLRELELKNQMDLELAKLQIQREREKEERQIEREKEERQMEREKEERQMQIQMEREREKEERQMQMQREEREMQFKLRELELANRAHSTPLKTSSGFDVTRYIRLVPPFQEKEVDKYFLHFEKIAENLKWPREHWTLLLQSVLIGKAREVYISLSVQQSTDYDVVKEYILKAYELVPEAYRQRFRNCRKETGQTHVEFARDKEQLFDRWCSAKKVDQAYDNLRQLVLIEEFKRCIHSDVKTYLDEQNVETLENAARMADDYSLTHKISFGNKSSSQQFSGKKPFQSHSSTSKFHNSTTVRNQTSDKTDQKSLSLPTCTYCKTKGHVISDCFKLKNKQQSKDRAFPNALISTRSRSRSCIESNTFVGSNKPQSDSILEAYEPFMSEGSISLIGDSAKPIPIKILRDTGASQSLLLSGTLPLSEESSSSESVLVQGVECGFVNVPLHCVNLASDLVSGPVTVGAVTSLPIEGVHLLLGNDLAGDKVVVNPLVTDKPCLDQKVDPVETEIPDLYPACAVTRAMAKRALESDVDQDIIPLADTCIGQSFDEVTFSSGIDQSNGIDHSDPLLATHSLCSNQDDKRQSLVVEQEQDPEISCLFQRAISETEATQVPVCYFVKNGVLMRKWRPPDVPAGDEWSVSYQIVVPKSYRQEILNLAHETPLAGHLGVRKTYHKILNHFYWPKLKSDVSKYCRSCHTCQMVGKPNQKIPKAHLQPIPAFDEPFSRIIVDCVGPLPKTKLGNQYLLTIMCASTRFPEAIPLRNIKTKTIVKALVKFFTLVGLPKSVQSDQGSNFMSGIFQQVMHELGIQQFKSSAYHPESQGALERFHQTLKNMIRSYCFDTEKDWDEGVHLLLFAVRESVQESLGFSPFELVFGHTVRGPLKLLKEKLLSNEDSKINLLDYVRDFKYKLSKACEVARTNLHTTQSKMKLRYDRNSQERSFKPGDKVLALFPIPQNPLQAKFFGPYTVEKKVNDLNYIINTPGRRKQKQLCHINMLKEYFDRDSPANHSVNLVVPVPHSEDINDGIRSEYSDSGITNLRNSEILNNLDQKLSHLQQQERNELKQLLHEYEHLFPDVPTRTSKIYHDVDIVDSAPVKQHPYRMNPLKQNYLKKEIQYLLENDFIEPSKSNWSSPCILVPKPDNTFRMCTDYRKVNSVTKTDSFPIPRMDDCIDKIGNAKYVTKFDLLKGFWQIPLTERAKEISAFVTPDGLYQYKVMPFGMKNSPATFQRLMNMITFGLDNCDAYIDDVIIYNNTWEDHLETIRKFFDRLSDANLTINLSKSEFCHACVTFLGHIVGQGQVKPIEAKVKAISEFQVPICKKQLMRFLGMAGYYRKFCSNFSKIAEPLTSLLSKKTKFCWSDKCQESFDKLKAMLKNAPVLSAPNFSQSFKLSVDASDVGVGGVLIQEDKSGVDHPVCYFSKKLNKHQKNYSTIEKECLALILALQHFEVYVTSALSPIIVYSDHNPLTFINKMKDKNRRLLRWSLILQEYNIDIKHIRGKDNVIADALSRA